MGIHGRNPPSTSAERIQDQTHIGLHRSPALDHQFGIRRHLTRLLSVDVADNRLVGVDVRDQSVGLPGQLTAHQSGQGNLERDLDEDEEIDMCPGELVAAAKGASNTTNSPPSRART